MTRRLSWNGQTRTAEADQIAARAQTLRQSLPVLHFAEAGLEAEEQGAHRPLAELEPLDWMVLTWQADQWSAASAWGAEYR